MGGAHTGHREVIHKNPAPKKFFILNSSNLAHSKPVLGGSKHLCGIVGNFWVASLFLPFQNTILILQIMEPLGTL